MRLIAHRGGALEAPEHTMRAYRQALAAGCDALELDLRATLDGAVVVLHDADVDRTTDGTGAIGRLRLAEARALDAAHRGRRASDAAPEPGPATEPGTAPGRGRATERRGAPDLRIPTLGEVLRAFPEVGLVLDLKVGPPELPGFPAAVAALLHEHGRAADVVVGSFSQDRLDAFRALAPDVATSASPEEVTAVVTGGPMPDAPSLAALQVPVRFGEVEIVTPAFVERAHAAGLEVHVWTVDEPDEARRLARLGVDALITDRPRLLAGVLGRGPAG